MSGAVAVTQRVTEEAAHREPRDALSHDWVAWLDAHGIVFVPLPNRLADPAAYLDRTACRAVLLSNGNDVGEWNGERPPVPGPGDDPAMWRDLAEFRVLRHAIERGLPVLGVCRGMQMINRFFGGRICRSLRGAGCREHAGCTHEVSFVDDGWREVLGARRHRVNSFHDQGIRAAELAPGLRATAVAGDGVVEAIEHAELAIRGIQWHPERPPLDDAANEQLVRWGLGL